VRPIAKHDDFDFSDDGEDLFAGEDMMGASG